MSKVARSIFEKLDMLAQGSGLFRVAADERTQRERRILETHEWRARLEALLKQAASHGADWVYFRLECEAGGPKPEVFIYDRSSTLGDSDNPSHIGQLQLELWNYGKVPLAFVFRPTAVEVFNLMRPPEFGPSGLATPPPLQVLSMTPLEALATAGAAAKGIAAVQRQEWQRFSGSHFDNGSFWEAPENRALGSGDHDSMTAMVQEMRVVRKNLEESFSKKGVLPDELAEHAQSFLRRLLILTLMVRFMEERGILPPGYFKDSKSQAACDFKSLLGRPKALLKALDQLAADFNGDIFKLDDSRGHVPIRAVLRALSKNEEALRPIADFADGRMKGDQRYFWERYSFRHLPVEAISYVYEDFLGGKSQSYYTPHHLVELLLDEAMPPRRVRAAFEASSPKWRSRAPNFSVLDPSCGSGVFLVGAWQRLVEALHLFDASPTPERLKQLMVQNIHGVDIEPDSVELTIFSLCVALCSSFPKRASDPTFTFRKLQELKFPNLKSVSGTRRNIDCGDFFVRRKALVADSLRFDVIVGNPPFASQLTPEAHLFNQAPADESGKVWAPVPDNNISYLFLRAVPPLLATGGRCCLVQNAGLIYNDKPHAFRKALFHNWHVPAILDFASISGLFKTRTPTRNSDSDSEASVGVKTVAVLIDHAEPDSSRPVLHVTFRRTFSLNEREVFEIDPQDLHWISRELAASERRVWKANLLGGGRLLETYKALTAGRTLEDFAKSAEKRGWVCQEGYIIGNHPKHHHPEVLGLSVVETSAFTDGKLDASQFGEMEEEVFHRPIDERLFTPPHLLVKEHESFPMVLRLKGRSLLFKDKIVGFAAPDTQENRRELRHLHSFLSENRDAAQFFAAFGPQYLIFRMGTPLKRSLMDLPYPENGEMLFHGVQVILRDDVINFMIPLIKDNLKTRDDLARDGSRGEVSEYAKVFRDVMRSAFPDLKTSGKPVDLGRAWCVAFHRGDAPPESETDKNELIKHLDGLLMKEMGRSLRCSRIVRHFHGKSLYIIKPKPRRYWLKSAAIRDADEMFAWWAAQSTRQSR